MIARERLIRTYRFRGPTFPVAATGTLKSTRTWFCRAITRSELGE